MASKPNPFAHLIKNIKESAAKPAALGAVNPKPEEKNISDSPNQGLTSPSEPAKDISVNAEQKVSQPVLTPQAQRLLGGPVEQLDSPLPTVDYNEQTIASDAQELARINTESMEPVQERQSNLNVEAARLGKKMQLDSIDSVRSLCDALDARLEAIGGAALEGPALSDTRNYVQSLMVTLKTRPEFAEVVIAKDIRNVMKFIRATRQEALELRELKLVKKSTRAANAEKKAKGKPSQSAFAKAFSNVMGIPDFSKLGQGDK